jgi:hypothetical protein
MPLENLVGADKFINDLVESNPVGSTDFKSSLDGHDRGIKNVLKNSFPNIDAAVTPTPAELNKLAGLVVSAVELGYLAGVTSAIQTQLNTLSTNKAPLANPTFTGTLAAGTASFFGVVTANDELALEAGYSEDADQYTATTGTRTLNTAAATYFYPSADFGTSTITFAFSNPAASGRVTSFTMELLGANDATLTWPTSVDWDGGTEPAWTAGKDIVSFTTRDNGTTWLGFLGGLDMK